MLVDGKLSSTLSNAIFIVSSDYIDAFGEQVKNLCGPTDDSDAATKLYVDIVDNELSSAISSKIWIEDRVDPESINGPADLSIMKLDNDDFNEYVALSSDRMSSDVLYIVESEFIEAYGQVLSNLSTSGVEGVSEAANVDYVEQMISNGISALSCDEIQLSSDKGMSVITSMSEVDGKI